MWECQDDAEPQDPANIPRPHGISKLPTAHACLDGKVLHAIKWATLVMPAIRHLNTQKTSTESGV